MTTTLSKIKRHDPCTKGWKKLLASLGKTKADDEPLPLLHILYSNGIRDAIWSLRTVKCYDREIRLFACDCAESVLPIFEAEHPDDPRPRNAIAVSRRYANGDATLSELNAASSTKWDASSSAAKSDSREAAWDAAWDAEEVVGAEERSKQVTLFRAMCEAAQ